MPAKNRAPTHGELVADLRLIRERGLGRIRHYHTSALTVACGMYGAPVDDARRPATVEALLREAVEQVGGGRAGEAASYSLGLVQGTKLWSATERRKAVAKAQGVSVERFRKGYEGVLLEQVAEGILTLLYEHGERPPSRSMSGVAPQAHNPDLYGRHGLADTTNLLTDELGTQQKLTAKLHEAGVIDFHLSRTDYSLTLAQFLAQAQSSIPGPRQDHYG
jgi:hypothetical protein